MSDATILHGPWPSKVIPLEPRPHFGQRKPGYLAGGFAEVLERPEDREEQNRIKDAARAARDALNGTPGAVCPHLKAELSAQIGVIAQLCANAAENAKALREARAAVSLQEMQSVAETLSASVSPYPPEMPA